MNRPGPLLHAMVNHGLSARWSDLPSAARDAVRTFLLDTLGVGIAGAAAPLTRGVRLAAERWGGPGTAHVWGPGGLGVTPTQAAFINGFQIHCQEFDCVHEPAVVHPLATILAALMAEAESRGPVSGERFGAAMAIAVDMAAGLGVAASSGLRFFRPATAGLFGATLGISRLRGFDDTRTYNALGLALAFASGTMQAHVEGKPALPVQIGNAAQSALRACDLAEVGMEGPTDSLEGPYGYLTLFETSHDIEPVIASLGRIWRIAEVSHKPFPTGRAAQGGIALMGQLRMQGVTPDAVERLTLTAPPLIGRLVGRPWTADMTPSYARLCFAYSGARALIQGHVGLDDFTPEALRDERVGTLAARIRIIDDGSDNPAAFTPQRAVAVLRDGREVVAQLTHLPGSPADPLSVAANEDKLRACVAFGFAGQARDIAERLITQAGQLDTLADVAVLSRLAAGHEEV